jgi:hypothetical protein
MALVKQTKRGDEYVREVLRIRADATLDALRLQLKKGVDRACVYELADSLDLLAREVAASLGVLCFARKVELWCENDDDRRRSIFRFKLPMG